MKDHGQGETQLASRVYASPLCVRKAVQDVPWRLAPRPVPQSFLSGLQVLCDEVSRAADRFEPLHVAYVQADDPEVPWTTYTPLNPELRTFRWRRRDWRVVRQIYACDSPVWLLFFTVGQAHDALAFYEDFCVQAMRWEHQVSPLVAGHGQFSPILKWTLGLFDLAWSHPSLRARPMYSSSIATWPATEVEHSIRNKLPNLLQVFFADVPLPLPGFFRVLEPDCFRSSAWRIRRVLECCGAGDPHTGHDQSNRPVEGITRIAAAKEVGVHVSTIRRWVEKDPRLIVTIQGKPRVNKAYLLANVSTLQEREFHGRLKSRGERLD